MWKKFAICGKCVIHRYNCQKYGRQRRSPGDEIALIWLSDTKWLNISHVSPRRNGRSTALKHSKNRKNTTLFGEYLQNYTSLYLLNLPRNRQMKVETSTKIIGKYNIEPSSVNADISTKHNINHHFKADDSQIYLSFKPGAAGEPSTSKLRIEFQPISWRSITTKLSSLFCTPVIDHNPR